MKDTVDRRRFMKVAGMSLGVARRRLRRSTKSSWRFASTRAPSAFSKSSRRENPC